MIAEDVVVRFDAEIREYLRKLDHAEGATKKATAAMGAASSGFGKNFSFGLTAAATAVGSFAGVLLSQLPSAIFNAIGSSLEFASSLKEVAQQARVTTDELQEYYYIATQVGMTSAEVENAFKMLARAQAQLAQGSKKQVQAAKELGYSMEEMARLARESGGVAMRELLIRINQLGDEAKQTQALLAYFGRSGLALAPLMKEGAAGIDAMIKKAHDLGLVLDESMIEKADEVADAWEEMKLRAKMAVTEMVASNAGAMLTIIHALADLIDKVRAADAAWSDFIHTMNIAGYKAAQLNPFLSDAKKKEARALAFRERLSMSDIKPGEFAKPTPVDEDYAPIPVKAAKDKKAEADRTAEKLRAYQDAVDQAAQAMAVLEAELSGNRQRIIAEQENTINVQRDINIRAIEADKDLTRAQKDVRIAQEQRAAELQKQVVEMEASTKQDKETVELDNQLLQNKIDMLKGDLAMIRTRDERAQVEREILEAEIQQKINAIELAKRAPNLSDEQMRALDAELRNAKTQIKTGMEEIDKKYAGPGKKALEELNAELLTMDDTLEQMAVDKIFDMGEALAQALPKALGLKGALGELVTEFMRMAIKMALIKPLLEAIFGGGKYGIGGQTGGIFGTIASVLGTVAKKQGGGSVRKGTPYMVGEAGQELFVPDKNGTIIPNHALGGQASPPPVVRVMVAANDYFDARVQGISGLVSSQVVQASAPQLIQAATAQTLNGISRPKM